MTIRPMTPTRLPAHVLPGATTSRSSPTRTHRTFTGEVTIDARGRGADGHDRAPRQGPRRRAASPGPRPDAASRADRSSADPERERITCQADGPLAAGVVATARRSGSPARSAAACSATTAAPTSTTTGTEQVLAATQFEAPHARRGVPVLRRARVQGRLRGHARSRRRAPRDLERSRGRPGACPATGVARPVRRHDPDVDVSRRVGRRPAGAHRAGRRGRRRRARRARAGQGAPHPVRARRRHVRDPVTSPTTTASRIRARSATSSRSPTSRSARWRTSAA